MFGEVPSSETPL